jgi:hypothetical protein
MASLQAAAAVTLEGDTGAMAPTSTELCQQASHAMQNADLTHRRPGLQSRDSRNHEC